MRVRLGADALQRERRWEMNSNVSAGNVWTFELIGDPRFCDMRPQHRRDWKKSQKKIRRERRQRMAYKKGGAK